jgi:hypothetical protein
LSEGFESGFGSAGVSPVICEQLYRANTPAGRRRYQKQILPQ